MKTLLDKIMNVLTRYDESTSAYITPTQEPFVRKELEEVVKQFEQADTIIRALAKAESVDVTWILAAQNYVANHPAQFGEKKEGGEIG